MRSRNLFRVLVTYGFIVIGLGVVFELFKNTLEVQPNVISAFRYFYWILNGITYGHLLLLIPFNQSEDEVKKTRWAFFLIVNYFVASLIAVALYALLFEQNKVEGLIAVSVFVIVFTLFVIILSRQATQ